MRSKKKSAFFVLLIILLLAKANFVLAAETLAQMASKLFSTLVFTTITLSGLVIAFGGLLYMFGGGVGRLLDKTAGTRAPAEAKEWIKAGVLGLLLSVTSYLIILTINPGLLSFNFINLGYQALKGMGDVQTTNSGATIINYDEIPIGKLTEELLTAKVNCYDFDPQGNPIESDEVKTDDNRMVNGPTYLNRDRADCLLRLTDAIEKKSLIAEELGQQINGLLVQCSCEQYGVCDDCSKKTGSWVTTPNDPEGHPVDPSSTDECHLKTPASEGDPDGGGVCVGCCTYASFGSSNQRNCPGNSESAGLVATACIKPDNRNEPELSCCKPSDRTQIKGYTGNQDNEAWITSGNTIIKKKHQSVTPFTFSLSGDCPATNFNTSSSATGFGIYNSGASVGANGYCNDNIPQDYYGLDEFYTKKTAEDIKEAVEKKYQVNKKDFIVIDMGNCDTCNNTCNCTQGDQSCLNRQQACMTTYQNCLTNYQKCVKKSPWGKLNLGEQIMYLNEKLKEATESLKDGQKKLTDAENKLLECPFARSYIDLKQIASTKDNTQEVIMVTKGATDIKNYCAGFSYGNSECYTSCSEICPITKTTLSCYKTCEDNIAGCNPSTSNCENIKSQCLLTCRNDQTCEYSQELGTFKNCMERCGRSCQDVCAKKYMPCSEEFNACKDMCGNDSSCVLTYLGQCIFSSLSLKECSENQADRTEEETKKCIENANLCKNGSDLFAGYPECLKPPADTAGKYSSSYIYQNQNLQICPDANARGVSISALHPDTPCKELYPKTQSCPASSNCPKCPCGSIDKTLTFSLENPVDTSESMACGADPRPLPQITCDPVEKPIKEYKITGPACSEPAYNDDPLTFYCRQDFWNEKEAERTEPLGRPLICPTSMAGKYQIIPVGKTVDDAIKWADAFKKIADELMQNSQTLTDLLKKASTEKEHCKCNSKYASGNPVCKACCEYVPKKDRNEDGDFSEPEDWAYCGFGDTRSYKPCSGNSCQQMIDWLNEIINLHSKIKSKIIDLTVFIAADQRSDVLKELTFSRNQTNNCSAVQDTSGPVARMIGCTKALDDIMSPIVDSTSSVIVNDKYINSYCYGRQAGKNLGASAQLSDNWFCCTPVVKEEAPQYEEGITGAHQSGAGGGIVQ